MAWVHSAPRRGLSLAPEGEGWTWVLTLPSGLLPPPVCRAGGIPRSVLIAAQRRIPSAPALIFGTTSRPSTEDRGAAPQDTVLQDTMPAVFRSGTKTGEDDPALLAGTLPGSSERFSRYPKTSPGQVALAFETAANPMGHGSTPCGWPILCVSEPVCMKGLVYQPTATAHAFAPDRRRPDAGADGGNDAGGSSRGQVGDPNAGFNARGLTAEELETRRSGSAARRWR